MGLPEYDPRNNVSAETNVDRGQIVMDAIPDEELEEFYQDYARTQHLNLGDARRAVEYLPAQDWDDGDGSEADIFNSACK
jgi:hypothetical protein